MRTDDSVVSRPGASWWVAAALSLVLAGIFVAAATTNPGEPAFAALCITFAIVLTVGALGVALFAARAVVSASSDGLRWRGALHGWRSAPWSGVRDYYVTLPSPLGRYGRSTACVIETSEGRIGVGPDWTHRAELDEMVSRHATDANAREWKLLGTRPGDATLTFSYHTISSRVSAPLFAAALAALIGAIGWVSAWSWEKHGFAAGQVPGALWIPAALFAAIGAAYGCGIVSMLVASLRADQRRRRDERIMVTSCGLRFENRDRVLAAAWPDVTGYGVRGVRAAILTLPVFTVSTRKGNFDFLPLLANRWLLMACIRQEAAQADGSWLERFDDAPLARDARPDPRAAGGRIHHYRTRTNRAILVLALALAAAVVSNRGEGIHLVPAAICASASGWLVWRYSAAAVRTDETGITQFAPFRTRFIPWSALSDAPLHDSDQTLVETLRGGGEAVRFWETISDVEALREEIRRRTAAG